MNRREFLGGSALAGAALAARPYVARAAREIIVTEPVHSTGYLPLYVGMAKGYFDDVTVKILTIETGSGHTNAVLTGQAFGFIGGPEHNAFAKAKGAELRAIVNCVDRGNIYACAAVNSQPANTDWASFVKGKIIAVGPFGGTPNSIARYLLGKWKLDAKKDVTLVEVANSAVLATVKSGQAQIGFATEPFLTQGIRQNVWTEPFFNVPKELGSYAYSTINVRLDTIQKDPGLAKAFVAGMIRGLKFTYANPAEASAVAKAQFPTMPLNDLKATLDRSFNDQMWSTDGMITPAAWDTAKSVVREAGILKSDVAYADIIDMSLVAQVKA